MTQEFESTKHITYKDILSTLRKIDIKIGDTIYVASSLTSLASMKSPVSQILQALYESVTKAGTIVMPSFSFAFCDEGVFDRENTPSQVGIISEAFRKEPGVSRTFAPPYATVCAWGSQAKEICSIQATSAFGNDSAFQYLYEKNAKILLIGCSFNDGVAQAHWLEERHSVSYRYWKRFDGKVIINGESHEMSFERYCRKEGITLDASKLEKMFQKSEKIKTSRLGLCRFVCFSTVDFATFFDPIFEKNNFVMLKNTFI